MVQPSYLLPQGTRCRGIVSVKQTASAPLPVHCRQHSAVASTALLPTHRCCQGTALVAQPTPGQPAHLEFIKGGSAGKLHWHGARPEAPCRAAFLACVCCRMPAGAQLAQHHTNHTTPQACCAPLPARLLLPGATAPGPPAAVPASGHAALRFLCIGAGSVLSSWVLQKQGGGGVQQSGAAASAGSLAVAVAVAAAAHSPW